MSHRYHVLSPPVSPKPDVSIPEDVREKAEKFLTGAVNYLHAFYDQLVASTDHLTPYTNQERLRRKTSIPSVASLLTPEGYDTFWETCDDILTRRMIYTAVMETGLVYMESFGLPRAPGQARMVAAKFTSLQAA